jgi:RimJ/RimL family protein N-acetyltransferase
MEIPSIVLRPLGEQDAPALMAFYNGLSPKSIRTFRPLGEKTSLDVCQQIVQEHLAPAQKRFDLVYAHGSEIVGWAFLTNLHSDQPDLGIAMAERTQGQGLGKPLLARLLGWAREKGIPKVILIVVQDNQRAINLYESHGFKIYGEEYIEADQLHYFQMAVNLSAEKLAT